MTTQVPTTATHATAATIAIREPRPLPAVAWSGQDTADRRDAVDSPGPGRSGPAAPGVGATFAPVPVDGPSPTSDVTVSAGSGTTSTSDALSIAVTSPARFASDSWASDSTHAPTSVPRASGRRDSMSSAISRAVAYRSCSSRCRPRSRISSQAGSSSGTCRLGGTKFELRTWCSTLPSFSPANRRLPVSASHSTTAAA